jgi:hypothetical protein
MSSWSNNTLELRNVVNATEVVSEMSSSSYNGYAEGPERELLAALLFDGVQSYLSYVRATTVENRSRFREAFIWVHRDTDGYVFSFESVCSALGIDPDYLRYGLANVSSTEILKCKKRS